MVSSGAALPRACADNDERGSMVETRTNERAGRGDPHCRESRQWQEQDRQTNIGGEHEV